jgi:hypothetical protein
MSSPGCETRTQIILIKLKGLAPLRENIRRFTTGEPMLNVVDKDKGY